MLLTHYHIFCAYHITTCPSFLVSTVELEEDEEEDPEFAGMFGQNFLDALYERLAVGMRDGGNRQGG